MEVTGLQLLFWLVVYGLVGIVLSLFALNWWLAGLFWPFFKVKASRGKKILVTVRNPVQDYYRVGEVVEDHLIYKNRQKITKRIPMMEGVVSRRATIFWVDVDDAKDCFFKRDDGKGASAYDAAKTDHLFLRCLYRPTLTDDMLPKVTLVLCIGILLVVIVVAVLTFKNGQKTDLILQSVQALQAATTHVTNSTVI